MKLFYSFLIAFLLTTPAFGFQFKRFFSIDDAMRLKDLSAPELSPDGKWVAYSVREVNLEKDSWSNNLFMIPSEGGDPVQLTYTEAGGSSPKWSPDGRFLAFLSSRNGDRTQVWLMDLRGGEPFSLTDVKSGVSSFEWSPDSKRLVLICRDLDPEQQEEKASKDKKTAPVIVVNRLQFKRDRAGFLKELYSHLYVVDLQNRKAKQITSGPYDDRSPQWSPDGTQIAFVSNRTEQPDSNSNTDIFVVPSDGGEARQLTKNAGSDDSPAWSEDGTKIAYVTVTQPELMWYATRKLALLEVSSGESRILTQALDRNVSDPQFADNSTVAFLVEDSGNQHVRSIAIDSGDIRSIVGGDLEIQAFDLGKEGTLTVLRSELHLPAEIFAIDADGQSKQLTFANRERLSQLKLGEVDNIHFRSADGTEIEGFVTKPPFYQEGQRYPTILWIHGGPVSQFSTSFNSGWQLFAAAGYVVVSANPRGSSGYGQDFCKAIFADWGNKDFQDVMAAVDYVVDQGLSDPERLGVGGWSYGGILTNYVITKTDRFHAAISGASETNFLACYGTDHYQREWETELGLPWENRALYQKLSPITYVDKIVTPTLVLCGEHDWNVPLNQSEQLYQSLKRLGRDTQLIVYPGQGHGISVPSYQVDRYQRFLAWYDQRLKR